MAAAHPYEVTTRRLFERDPRAWPALAGVTTPGALTPVDPGLPTLGATAAKVVRVTAGLRVSARCWPSLCSRARGCWVRAVPFNVPQSGCAIAPVGRWADADRLTDWSR